MKNYIGGTKSKLVLVTLKLFIGIKKNLKLKKKLIDGTTFPYWDVEDFQLIDVLMWIQNFFLDQTTKKIKTHKTFSSVDHLRAFHKVQTSHWPQWKWVEAYSVIFGNWGQRDIPQFTFITHKLQQNETNLPHVKK